ncbi:MAG: penicillin-binding protein [Corynebacteriales bacterium]|nr:penicillin-binding protein [Mycobacteriales bacterium]
MGSSPRKSNKKRWWFATIAAILAIGVTVALLLPFNLWRWATLDYDDMPASLRNAPLPLRTEVYAADGTPITTFFDQNRIDLPLEAISSNMIAAIIAAEDIRFLDHGAFDERAIFRAMVSNVKNGSISEGGSTLTQQYVKQALLYNADTDAERQAAIADTVDRKAWEVRYAMLLEDELSKAEILRRYLNISNFGNGAYGVGTAAKRYFNKDPKDLTVEESALLAAMVKSPTGYDPFNENTAKAAKERRDYVIGRMGDMNYLSDDQEKAAKKTPVTLDGTPAQQNCVGGDARFGFFCGYLVSWIRGNPEFGSNPDERIANLQKGGYRIYTSIDPTIQAAAQQAVDNAASADDPFAHGIVMVEPGSGKIRAMAINRNYSLEPNPDGGNAPNTTNPLLWSTKNSPGYQAGSTFKMFTAIAALTDGMPLSTTIDSPDRYQTRWPGSGAASCNGFYCPKNASPDMAGSHNMWTGFGRSVNTYFVQLEERVGPKAAVETAQKMGIQLLSPEDQRLAANADEEWGSFTLGTAQASPLDVANAYATVAARGKYHEPNPVERIVDRDGSTVALDVSPAEQVIDPEVADAATDMARCPVGDQSTGGECQGGTATSVHGALDRPVAGKTGTTDDNNAAWFAGFTPQLAAASFKVNPDSPNESVGETNSPIEIFKSAMSTALEGQEVQNFTAPPDNLTIGEQVRVPNLIGKSPGEAADLLRSADLSVATAPDTVFSQQPEGTVANSSPASGSSVPKGTTVILTLSAGPEPTPTPTPTPSPTPTPTPSPSYPTPSFSFPTPTRDRPWPRND